MEKPVVLTIVGQTASGKSALAVLIAERIRDERVGEYDGAEVISADSRQVYRGLDIGSGKVTSDEMRTVPHHLLDVADPRERFSVAAYRELAARAIREVTARNRLPILCGGTGLYVDTVLRGLSIPPVPPNAALRRELAGLSVDELAERLSTLDPRRAGNIDTKNRRRLERAIEVTGVLGSVPERTTDESYRTLELGIAIERETLDRKIGERLRTRLDHGMVEEVERLHAGGVTWERLDELGLEYRSVARYLRGVLTREEMIVELEQDIRAYARRQLTWFKRNIKIVWLRSPDEALELVRHFLNTHASSRRETLSK